MGNHVPNQIQGLPKVSFISAGKEFSLAVSEQGEVYAWGANNHCQAGGTSTLKIIPTPTKIEKLKDIVQVSCGSAFSLGLDKQGGVWAWGESSFYSHNMASETSFFAFARKIDSITVPCKQVYCGASNCFAIDRDGRLWGLDKTYSNVSTGTFEQSIVAFGVGSQHQVATLNSGITFSWGENLFGKLGIGSTVDSSFPTPIPASFSFTEIACGLDHSLAIDKSGILWAWGCNSSKQLGTKTNSSGHRPMPIWPPGLAREAMLINSHIPKRVFFGRNYTQPGP
jgi:alpha-tubulin suppressor-like RCC1 family protein